MAGKNLITSEYQHDKIKAL